jgi:hypothetical protein
MSERRRRLGEFRNVCGPIAICAVLLLGATQVSAGIVSWLRDPSPDFVKAIRHIKIKPPKGIGRNPRAARTYVYWNTAVAYQATLFKVGGLQKEQRYLGQAMIKIPVRGVDEVAVKEVLTIGHFYIALADEWDRLGAPRAASFFTVGAALLEMAMTAPQDKKRALALEAEAGRVARRLSAKYKLRLRRFVIIRSSS